MTQSINPNSEPSLGDVLDGLEALNKNVDSFRVDLERSNERFETYRKANQSLVNLAFGLIASAAISVFVAVIFK